MKKLIILFIEDIRDYKIVKNKKFIKLLLFKSKYTNKLQNNLSLNDTIFRQHGRDQL